MHGINKKYSFTLLLAFVYTQYTFLLVAFCTKNRTQGPGLSQNYWLVLPKWFKIYLELL